MDRQSARARESHVWPSVRPTQVYVLLLFRMSIVSRTQLLVIPTFASVMIISAIVSVAAKRKELENISLKERQAAAQKPRPSIAAPDQINAVSQDVTFIVATMPGAAGSVIPISMYAAYEM